MRFLHVSDLHIHGSENHPENMRVKKRLQYIEKHFPNHVLIVTGDVTDDGATEQYELAKGYLAPFKDRCCIVPGNHDYGFKGLLYSAESKRFFEEAFKGFGERNLFAEQSGAKIYLFKNILLIALNSNLQTINPFDFACGSISAEQIEVVKKICKSPLFVTTKKIVAFHHHLFCHTDPLMRLSDSQEVINALEESGVDVVCFGHRHKSAIWKNRIRVPHVLAAGGLFDQGCDAARQITIEGGAVAATDVFISGC